MSHKVIESDTDRSGAYDVLLVISSNHGPISYRFRNRTVEKRIFYPCVFNTRTEEVRLRIL